MKYFIILAGLALASCTSSGTLTPAATTVVTVACAVDNLAPTIVQTGAAITAIVNPATAADVASANKADQLVHPAVQAACAAALAGSKPAAVTVVPVSQ